MSGTRLNRLNRTIRNLHKNHMNNHVFVHDVALEYLRRFDQGKAVSRQIALDSYAHMRYALNTMALCFRPECETTCQALVELLFATEMFEPRELHRYYKAQMTYLGLE